MTISILMIWFRKHNVFAIYRLTHFIPLLSMLNIWVPEKQLLLIFRFLFMEASGAIRLSFMLHAYVWREKEDWVLVVDSEVLMFPKKALCLLPLTYIAYGVAV